MKRFTYLLGQTELFQHFIDLKVSENQTSGMKLMTAAKGARVWGHD